MSYKKVKINTKIGQLGDLATEYWTDKDWEAWRKEVKRMKKDGTYMKPVKLTFCFNEIEGLSDSPVNDFKDMGLIIPD